MYELVLTSGRAILVVLNSVLDSNPVNPAYQALVAAVARSNVTVLAGPGGPRRGWGPPRLHPR